VNDGMSLDIIFKGVSRPPENDIAERLLLAKKIYASK